MSGVGLSLHISDVHFNFDFHYSSRIAVLSSGPSLSNFVRNLITKFARHRVGLIYRKQFRWNFISFQPGPYLSGLASPATDRDSFSFSHWAIELSPNNGLQSWRNLKMSRILNASFLIILHFLEMILLLVGNKQKAAPNCSLVAERILFSWDTFFN